MTVLEAIHKSAVFLEKKGVESPRLNAEWLLAHLLKMPRMKLYLNFDRGLTAPETNALRDCVTRRGQHEPLQHITGSAAFCGHEILVTRDALVPRPETELLAEAGWKFLETLSPEPATVLDFGTGTGCLAITLAARCPSADVTALDLSAAALALAQQNASQNGVAERIEFLPGDGFAAFQPGRRAPRGPESNTDTKTGTAGGAPPGKREFDLIISNPPYIPSAEIETLQPEVRDFDPRAALDGGPDGLDFYRRLAAEAKAFLKTGGKIMVEFGDGQADDIQRIFEAEKWVVEAVQADYSQRARILIAHADFSATD